MKSIAKTKAEIQKEYAKRSEYVANKKYNKERTKLYGVRVVISTEEDIYNKLEQVPNTSGYIKSLIRKDIAEQSKTE